MEFIHFGRRMKIEKLFYEWCESEGVANKPNSMIVFLMEKGWLNGKKVIEDLADTPQTEETEAERLDRIDNEIEDAWARIKELTPHTDCQW